MIKWDARFPEIGVRPGVGDHWETWHQKRQGSARGTCLWKVYIARYKATGGQVLCCTLSRREKGGGSGEKGGDIHKGRVGKSDQRKEERHGNISLEFHRWGYHWTWASR